MSGGAAFTDPDAVSSMEAEHRPLWRAFFRAFAPLLVPGARVMDFGCNRGGMLRFLFQELENGSVVPPSFGAFFPSGGAVPPPVRVRSPLGGTVLPSVGVGIDEDTPAMRTLLASAAEAVRGRTPLLFTTSSPRTFPGQFDLVVSHEVVYLLPDLHRTFADIHAALAPAGHFCFATGSHVENPWFPKWSASLESEGLTVHARRIEEYEAALRDCAFDEIARDRLLLSPAEYLAWTEARGSAEPNPAWFPDAAAERSYYTEFGKIVLTARKR